MKTPEMILAYLKRNEFATVYDLSTEFKLTRANIRFHLKHMLQSGSVSVFALKPKSGAGRPAILYTIENSIPVSLYKSILSEIAVFFATDTVSNKCGIHLAEQIAIALLGKTPKLSSRTTGIIWRVSHLSKFGFIIQWESGPVGPVINIQKNPLTNIFGEGPLSREITKHLISYLIK